MPVIVEARWDGAAFRTRYSYEGGRVIAGWEGFTRLVVRRVIKGTLSAGTYPLILEPGVAWNRDGTFLNSGTSTEVIGDVPDVTKPALWFLKRGPSRLVHDGRSYLRLTTYRGVQPLALAPYYDVLCGSDRDQRIVTLLSSPDPTVVQRALGIITGPMLPWPYGGDGLDAFIHHPMPSRKPLPQHAGAVRVLIAGRNAQVRALAAAVYASLVGSDALPAMRELLQDADPVMRAIAIGILASRKDDASTGAMAKAAVGVTDDSLAVSDIAALADWGVPGVIPTLIAFLDIGDGEGGVAENMPALRAQKELQRITGYTFPCDAAAAGAAWAAAVSISDRRARLQRLAELAAYDPAPLEARCVRTGDRLSFVVRNRSASQLTITRVPISCDCNSSGGTGFWRIAPSTVARDEYVSVLPGSKLSVSEIKIEGVSEILRDGGSIVLNYTCRGRRFGLRAWIGQVAATVPKRDASSHKAPHTR